MNYVVNIDWLAVHGHIDMAFNPDKLEDSFLYADIYTFKRQEYSGRVYKYKFCIYDSNNQYVYDLYCIPYSAIIPANSCQVRLSNEECYRANKIERLFDFMQKMGIVYKNISRLDVCLDSNYLHGGLKHENLIRNWFNGKFLLNRKATFNLFGMHKNSNVITGLKIEGKRKMMMKTDAKEEETDNDNFEHTGLRFGSVKSAVAVKMYNKTIEMKEVKEKPYIVDCWKDNGLDLKKDVWRIEFSINADATNMVRLDSGELFRLSLGDIEMDRQNQELFFNMSFKYLRFKRNDGTKNKTRMDDVQLFTDDRKPTYLRCRPSTVSKSNKMDKYVLKRIIKEREDKDTFNLYEQNLMTYMIYAFAHKYRVTEMADKELRCQPEIDLREKQKLLIRLENDTLILKEEIRKELKTI